jgi:DNA-binding transcriptional LysR family regulator
MTRVSLELDLLRSLVSGTELGSFARAAEKVGRSQSAVSLQMKKLESLLEVDIFEKQGRALSLTPAGIILCDYARRMLDLNEEAVAAVRGAALSGSVRFGMSVDFENTWLPATLARFGRAHANVSMEIRMERNSVLAAQIDHNELDIALLFGHKDKRRSQPVAELDMAWIGRPDLALPANEPLPLLLLDHPCIFRRAALKALDAANIRWRVAVTSPSLGGLWAAAQAGLGITVRTEVSMPRGLVNLGRALQLPDLPTVDLSIHQSGKSVSPVVATLKSNLLEVLRENLPA